MEYLQKYVGAAVLIVIAGYLVIVRAGGEDFMKQLGSLGLTQYIEAMKSQDDLQERMSKSSGTATIFIPNDAAMGKSDDWKKIKSDKRKMRRFLKYTILLSDLTVDQCVQKERHVTADGTEVTIKKEGGDIVIIADDGKTKAKVITKDTKFSNGYLNVIDAVLLPKDI